jgi:hypothetical protein
MSAHKLYLEGKRIQQRAAALSNSALSSREKINVAEELLKEIDDLAVLLDQVKKQSDRIQAMADAIGDSIVDTKKSDSVMRGRSKSEFSAAAKTRPRLRFETFPTAPSAPDGADR